MITLHVYTDAGELAINLDSMFEDHKMEPHFIQGFKVKVDGQELIAIAVTPPIL